MTHISELDRESLELIFKYVCSNEHGAECLKHNGNLPLVSKTWASVYTNSFLLWKHIHLDFESILSASHPTPVVTQQQHQSRCQIIDSVFAWLQRRGSAILTLTLSNCHLISEQLDAQLYYLTNCTTKLQSIVLNGCAGGRGRALSCIQAPTVEHITTTCHRPLGPPQPTPLRIDTRCFNHLTMLPHLQSLDLSFDTLLGDGGELAALGDMRCLTRLKLASRSECVLLLPTVLMVLHGVADLELENLRLPPITTPIIQALSSVHTLKLISVLAAQPRRRAGLTLSLWQSLAFLPNLRHLTVKDVGPSTCLPATAFVCPQLKSLTIMGSKRLNTWRVNPEWHSLLYNTDFKHGKSTRNSRSTKTSSMKISPPASLRHFHVQDCTVDFAEIPTSLPSLSNLTSLTWSNIREAAPMDLLVNQLTPRRHLNLPPFLWHLAALVTLRLEYSGIRELPPDRASYFPRLEALSLEGNPLNWDGWAGFVAGLIYHTNGKFHRLSLANTQLERLPDEAEQLLSGIKELELGRTLVAWCPIKLAALAKVGSLKRIGVGAGPLQKWLVSCDSDNSCNECNVVCGGEALNGLIA